MAAPAPSLGSPTPRFLRLWLRVIVVLYVLLLCAAALSWWIGSSDLLFIAQMGLLTTTLCLIPTVAYLLVGERRIVARVIVETLLFVALLVGFSLWVFGTAVLRIWIAYAVTVILLLEAGGHMIQWYLVSTLERLSTSVLFWCGKCGPSPREDVSSRNYLVYIRPAGSNHRNYDRVNSRSIIASNHRFVSSTRSLDGFIHLVVLPHIHLCAND